MDPVKVPRIKICCIASREEAALAVRYGASALGLVSSMPSGPGVIHEDSIVQIAMSVPVPIATFLLTSKQDSHSIIEQQRRCRTSVIQIVDRLTEGSYLDFRNELPGIGIVQVVHVAGERSINEAMDIAPFVDAILLDSGNPSLEVKELGGTGRTHDWSISRRIREALNIPIFLAGGINPLNVAEAIRAVHPFGVDVCSGVRTEGKLDEKKLSELFRQITIEAK
jgi:phosphoribosylanthranilate isomerase